MREEGRGLHIKVRKQISDVDLRELIALFHRYKVDMRPLAVFETSKNAAWFRDSRAFWHDEVFDD